MLIICDIHQRIVLLAEPQGNVKIYILNVCQYHIISNSFTVNTCLISSHEPMSLNRLRDCYVGLPHDATDLSAVCDCGIS